MTYSVMPVGARDTIRGWANVSIDVVDALTGVLRRRHVGHNIITDVGLAVLAAGLAGGAVTITHFALGDDNTAAVAGDTALGHEVARPVITGVSSAANVAIAQFYLSSGTLNGANLREAGLYVGEALLARYVYADADLTPKTSAVAVVFTWTITIVRS